MRACGEDTAGFEVGRARRRTRRPVRRVRSARGRRRRPRRRVCRRPWRWRPRCPPRRGYRARSRARRSPCGTTRGVRNRRRRRPRSRRWPAARGEAASAWRSCYVGSGVRSGVSEDRSKCSEGGGEIGGAGWEDRCARWRVGAIGIDAWGGHRVRCAPHDACYSCSGHSEWVRAGAFAQTFISLGSVQNHFVRAGPLRRSEARCRPRRVSSLRRLRTASALAGSRR